MERIPTVFVYAGGPSETLDGRALLVSRGEELQVLVWLTRAATVATFRRRALGLMIGGRGGGGTVSNSCPVTHNCRTRTDAFPLRAPRATTDTSARGR